MPRKCGSRAVLSGKSRSRFVDYASEQPQASAPGRLLSRRAFAYRNAAVLNAAVLAEYAVGR